MSETEDDEGFSVPEGVGPHTEQELKLLMSGDKPLAMSADERAWGYDFGYDRFEQYVTSGELVKRTETYNFAPDGSPLNTICYARPEEAWRLSVMHALNQEIFQAKGETGLQSELLGYSDKDIRAFIDWTKRDRPRQE